MDERKWTFKKVVKKTSLFSFLVILLLLCYGLVIYFQTQQINDPKKCFTTSMYQIKLCPTSPSYVSYHQVPTLFYRALIISEDASFYMHNGFDWFEIKESFRQNLLEFRFARGGSTLTQQLAKNLYLQKEKSLSRKFKEFFISKQIEKYLSKTQILEKYVNVVEFADKTYGIKSAAQHFFSKSPKQLNILESIYLVSLLPNPKSYSLSFNNKKLSKTNVRRMKTILTRLYRTKRINDNIFVYCEMLLDSEPWPFPYFSEDGFSDDIRSTVEDELFLELDQTESRFAPSHPHENEESQPEQIQSDDHNNGVHDDEFIPEDDNEVLLSPETNNNDEKKVDSQPQTSSEKVDPKNEPPLDKEIEIENDEQDDADETL